MLTVANNVSSLIARNQLSRTTNALSSSLERLSTGLKINRGADGPAALIISELQRAQIAGLEQAIENADRAGAMVQTAEGALSELNTLLIKARELALDSANAAVHDTDTLAANQAELDNIIDTINRIAANTRFGSRNLLDGSAGVTGSASDSDVTFIRATSNTTTGTYAVSISTAGERATVTAGTAQTSALGQDETLTINGVLVTLTAGMTQAQVIERINQFTGQTGVIADNGGPLGETRLYTVQFGSSASVAVQSNVAAAADSTGFGTTQLSDTGVDVAGTIGGAAATGHGNVLTGNAGTAVSDLSISLGLAAGSKIATVMGDQGTVTVEDHSLVFQIGPNSSQTAEVAIDNVAARALGLNVSGAQFANLSQIDIQSPSGAQDAIEVIDQAISEISALRGRLGAFQQNTLQATQNNLRATLENTVAAESVIRDTDFAAEVAAMTKQQVLLQAGISVMSAANQLPQLVLALLQ